MAANPELRTFLRASRARLRPEDVGLPAGGRRRVPGLRREEVAQLAGVSLDYYARLEQGRDLQPSDGVLDAIAGALRLDAVGRRHLHALVRATLATVPPPALRTPDVDEGLRTMLDALPMPALVLDARGDVQALNAPGRALLVGLEVGANHARWVLLDPAARALHADWEVVARQAVAVLRDAASRHPHDPLLQALVGELAVRSEAFRTWWAEHEVAARCRGTKRLRHPDVGELALHTEAMELRGGEQVLYTYSAAPGTPAADALALLGVLGATRDAVQPEAVASPRS